MGQGRKLNESSILVKPVELKKFGRNSDSLVARVDCVRCHELVDVVYHGRAVELEFYRCFYNAVVNCQLQEIREPHDWQSV